ncbi:Ig-like domain-containing protein [Pontiellaceae bacterium B12219]|nr:Ig-like domain-containing protein [Pontiellaceae bacterium B12219]
MKKNKRVLGAAIVLSSMLLGGFAAQAAPILWDIGKAGNTGSQSTAADFIAAGVPGNLSGATVANVAAAQNMTNGNIVLSLSQNPNANAAGAAYTGAGSSIIKDYAYFKNMAGTVTNTISGLSLELEPNTDYNLWIWGKGDNANQIGIITYDGVAQTISSADPFSTNAGEFAAKFTFTTGATVADTLEFLWNGVNTYTALNGFSITDNSELEIVYSTTPADGSDYVATDAAVSVTFTNGSVSLSNLYVGCEMVVNSTDVTGDVVISYPTTDTMKFEYVHGGLAFGQDYDVQLSVARSDAVTNEAAFSFTTTLDPDAYLIAPGVRNGGFELVNGVAGETGIVSDWSQIDDWGDDSGAGAKTEAIPSPTEGTRALVTGNGSETYNITTNTISDGDIFEYQWTIPARNNGVSAGLVYLDGGSVVIVSNSLVYVSGGASPAAYSGSFLFDAATSPDAIGKQVGMIFIDDNSGSGAVYIDEVLLSYGNIAVKSVSPAADATGVAKTAPIEVVIAEAASQVDTNSIVLTLDGADVTTNAVISDTASGITLTYTPAAPLAVGKHFASIAVSGTPEGTASQSWSFLVDPTGIYLVSPDVRNGSFELVGGAEGSTAQVNDWSQIDNWSDDSAAGAKTEANSLATDGSRIMVTATGSETYNMTDTVIGNGDRFGYSFVIVGRSYGVTAALAYLDGTDVVVVSNSMTEVFGGTTPFPISGEYTFTSGTDPDAVGKTIGVIFIDDGNTENNGAVQIDDVRLYADLSTPTEEPVIQEFSVDGSTITLSWTSQNIGLYSLQSKSDLSDYVEWVSVLSNLPSGNLTTNLPVSGADAEFYRIISE